MFDIRNKTGDLWSQSCSNNLRTVLLSLIIHSACHLVAFKVVRADQFGIVEQIMQCILVWFKSYVWWFFLLLRFNHALNDFPNKHHEFPMWRLSTTTHPCIKMVDRNKMRAIVGCLRKRTTRLLKLGCVGTHHCLALLTYRSTASSSLLMPFQFSNSQMH